MFDDIENLKLVTVSHGVSKPFSKVENRKINAFLFRTEGMAVFDFGNEKITTHKGEMIFLPKGCSYNFTRLSEDICTYTSINFEADLKDVKPMLYSLEDFSEAYYIAKSFPSMWNLGGQSEKYQCLSLMYALLAYLSNAEHQKYSDKKKFHIIAPAVEYMKNHIFDKSLKVDTLHQFCGVSDTYFRKIFIAKFGVSPIKYIINKRISYAKAIIDTGDFHTINEVADSVGYSDALHFSRAFKKKYGVSPINLNKENNIQ